MMKGGDPYIGPYVCSWFYKALLHLYNHKCYNQHTIPECVLLNNGTGIIQKNYHFLWWQACLCHSLASVYAHIACLHCIWMVNTPPGQQFHSIHKCISFAGGVILKPLTPLATFTLAWLIRS